MQRLITILVAIFMAIMTQTFSMAQAHAGNNAIARLNYAGFNKRSNCTAALISKRAALTARHCVIHKRAKDIHLVFGYRKGEWVEHRRGRKIFSHKKRDIAIVCLNKPSKLKPIPLGDVMKKGRILTATATGYQRSRPHLPSQHTCPFQAGRDHARFDCPLEPGMSGAPVILENGKSAKIVGVVSGTTASYSVIELAVDLPKATCIK